MPEATAHTASLLLSRVRTLNFTYLEHLARRLRIDIVDAVVVTAIHKALHVRTILVDDVRMPARQARRYQRHQQNQ